MVGIFDKSIPASVAFSKIEAKFFIEFQSFFVTIKTAGFSSSSINNSLSELTNCFSKVFVFS